MTRTGWTAAALCAALLSVGISMNAQHSGAFVEKMTIAGMAEVQLGNWRPSEPPALMSRHSVR